MAEHLFYTQKVTGSTPVASTKYKYGDVAHLGGHLLYVAGADPAVSATIKHGALAQLGEHFPCKEEVVGSTPTEFTIYIVNSDKCCYIWYNRRMNSIVFLSLNLVSSNMYIGVTSRPDRKWYLGSGKLVKKAIKKHGRHNFVRITLGVFEKEEDAYRMEFELVNENWVSRPDTYNLKVGGHGGWKFVNEREELKEKAKNNLINKVCEEIHFEGKKFKSVTEGAKYFNVSRSTFNNWVKKGKRDRKSNTWNKGKSRSEKDKKKISEGVKQNGNWDSKKIPCFYKGIWYESKAEAARQNNMSKSALDLRLKLGKEPKEKTDIRTNRSCVINGIKYKSRSAASRELKISRQLVNFRIKSNNFKNYVG